MANGYTHAECYYMARQIWTKECLKTRNSKDGCTFPPNIFAPIPKNHRKTPFLETFQCKAYYTHTHTDDLLANDVKT